MPTYDQRCDLLKNIYLCGINNNRALGPHPWQGVVICLKISTFVVSTTTEGGEYTSILLL